jgi:hypothetical protein
MRSICNAMSGLCAALGVLMLLSAVAIAPVPVYAGYTTNGCSCTGCGENGGTCSGTNCASACGCNDKPGTYVCNKPT